VRFPIRVMVFVAIDGSLRQLRSGSGAHHAAALGLGLG